MDSYCQSEIEAEYSALWSTFPRPWKSQQHCLFDAGASLRSDRAQFKTFLWALLCGPVFIIYWTQGRTETQCALLTMPSRFHVGASTMQGGADVAAPMWGPSRHGPIWWDWSICPKIGPGLMVRGKGRQQGYCILHGQHGHSVISWSFHHVSYFRTTRLSSRLLTELRHSSGSGGNRCFVSEESSPHASLILTAPFPLSSFIPPVTWTKGKACRLWEVWQAKNRASFSSSLTGTFFLHDPIREGGEIVTTATVLNRPWMAAIATPPASTHHLHPFFPTTPPFLLGFLLSCCNHNSSCSMPSVTLQDITAMLAAHHETLHFGSTRN